MKNFTKHFEKAVAHNQANDKKKSFHVTYKKLNGRTVKRKIDPVSLRNNVVVAFDHKRQALRSFKIERLKGMEKAAFWKGFEKSALNKRHLAIGAGVAGAGLLGGVIGHKKGLNKGRSQGLVAGALHERTKKHLSPDEKILHYAVNKKTNDKMFITNKGRRLVYKYNAEKTAGGESALYHGAELLGLGVLAAPSVMHMAKMKPMSEKNYHRAEVAGLGILAAPSMIALAKKFKPMKGLINKIPSVL